MRPLKRLGIPLDSFRTPAAKTVEMSFVRQGRPPLPDGPIREFPKGAIVNRTHRRTAAALVACVFSIFLSCAACAPHQSTEGSANRDADSTQSSFIWSYDSKCEQCHQRETASMETPPCLANLHAEQGNTCATCHTDARGLSKAHEGATPDKAETRATKLRSTSIDENVCFSCHGDYEELAIRTSDSTLLTDSEGTTVNPHALPENEEHASSDCSSCHAMHTEDSVEKSAREHCESCHHAGVYACHTCHD